MTSNLLPVESVLESYPSDPDARSHPDGDSTTLYFINELPQDHIAEICQIDYQGHRKPWARVIGVGVWESHETTAYVHQPWEVTISCKGEIVKTSIYHPKSNPACVILHPSPDKVLVGLPGSLVPNAVSPDGGASTTIEFENLLQVKVDIFYVTSAGELVPRGEIHPGSSYIQYTLEKHAWRVVADYDGLPFAVFYAAPHGGLAMIDEYLFRK